MNVRELINDLRRLDVTLTPAGDKLRWHAPKGALTAELLDLLRQHKPAVLELLRQPRLFPYPLPASLGAGDVDPLDYVWVHGEWTYRPGWWRAIPERIKRGV